MTFSLASIMGCVTDMSALRCNKNYPVFLDRRGVTFG